MSHTKKHNDPAIVIQLKSARAAYAANVKEIADSGYFKSQAAALNFFEAKIHRLWRSQVGTAEEANLVQQMRITDTMLRMIHLMASLQHRIWGDTHRKHPRLAFGVPFIGADKDGNRCISFSRAIPKADIAAMIGRSVDTVDDALKRFRGRGKTDDFYQHQLAVVLSVETGIFLDALLSRQLQFEFMTQHTLEAGDYEKAKVYAWSQRISGGETWTRQIEHAERAKRAINAAEGVVTLEQAGKNARAALAKTSPDQVAPLELFGS